MPVSVKNDYPSEADETLVKWAQQGDTEAFEQLVFRHRDKIYARALMMMRNEDQALEYSQEAWVKSWQRLVQFQGDSSFATWVTRIVINLCLDQLRRQKRVRTESIEAMEEESGGVEHQRAIRQQASSKTNSGGASMKLWGNSPTPTGPWWSFMNLRGWNTRRSPSVSASPSGRSCRVSFTRAAGWHSFYNL